MLLFLNNDATFILNRVYGGIIFINDIIVANSFSSFGNVTTNTKIKDTITQTTDPINT